MQRGEMTFSRGEANRELTTKQKVPLTGGGFRGWVTHRIFRTYTSPENPINAIARIDAVIRAIGTPWKAFGASSNSIRSRKPAKITNAKAKPNAIDTL